MKLKNSFINLMIVILILALVAVAVITYLDVTQNNDTPQVNLTTAEVSHDYQIISRTPLKIWPGGTVFPQGMLAYFYASNPYMPVVPKISANNIGNNSIHGTISSQVMLRAINDKSEAYWSYLLNKTSEETFQLSSEHPSYSAKTVYLDPTDAYNQALAMADEIKFQTSQFQLIIFTEIKLSGSIQNNPFEKSYTQELPITLQAINFTVSKSQDLSSNITLNKNTIQTSNNTSIYNIFYNHIYQFIMLIILLICILILYRIKSKTQPKLLLDHRKYKDWITEGSVEVTNQYFIQIHTLQGLVDLAIDLDKRIIYDSRVVRYYVMAEDMIYVFDGKQRYSPNNSKQQLGRLLLNQGLIQPQQLEMALYYQNKIGYRLGESLIALGFVDETTLFSTLAAQSKLDYYDTRNPVELDQIDLQKLDKNKVKALMTVPLGNRADGKLVVACSEFSREGILEELKKVYGSEVHVVATSPSFVNRILERIDHSKTELREQGLSNPEHLDPSRYLSSKELEEFKAAYYRGTFQTNLFIQGTGIIDHDIISQIPKQESLLSWLTNKHTLNSDLTNLIKGLDKSISALERNERQAKLTPSLTSLLIHSNYMTEETLEWVNQELTIQRIPVEMLLSENLIVSSKTVEQAKVVLNILSKILECS